MMLQTLCIQLSSFLNIFKLINYEKFKTLRRWRRTKATYQTLKAKKPLKGISLLLTVLIKFYPIVCSAWIMLCMVGQLFSVDASLTSYPLFGQSYLSNLIFFLLSIKMKFCYWHRTLLITMTGCLTIEYLNIYGLENNYYIWGNIVTCLIGFIILTAYGYCKKHKKTNNESQKRAL